MTLLNHQLSHSVIADLEISFYIINKNSYRCRLEHGFLEYEVARTIYGLLLAVVNYLPIHIRFALGKHVRRNQ